MHISVRLLGELNESSSHAGKTLVSKKMISVTAEQLATWFLYDSLSGKHPFRIKQDSLIQIDPIVQRGFDDRGRPLQESAKVKEIRDLLLGSSTKAPVFLGTLVWVIRGDVQTSKSEKKTEGKFLPTFELGIEVDKILLTDSAHRHFGIVEAYRTFMKNKENYPRFSPKFEFPVELYVIDKAMEQSLFNELNSKQKKVSQSRTQLLDVQTASGYLKSKILERDQSSKGLFANNVEVSFRENKRHTLLTMSTFVNILKEFYSPNELESARNNDADAEEMSEYFCEFFYDLSEKIIIKYNDGSGPVEINPFYNLYRDHIASVMDREFDSTNDEELQKFESDLEKARERANEINRKVRDADVTNSNPMMRALARLARTIRYFEDWKAVISRLQSSVIAPADGRYFQISNKEISAPFPPPYTTPLITVTSGGGANIQVQTQTIKQAYDILSTKLDLVLPVSLRFKMGSKFSPLKVDVATVTQSLSRTAPTVLVFEGEFYIPKGLEYSGEDVSLSVKAKDLVWKKAEFTGTKKKAASQIKEDDSYQHPFYDDIKKMVAQFGVELPAFNLGKQESFVLELKFLYPSLSGDGGEVTALLQLQPNAD